MCLLKDKIGNYLKVVHFTSVHSRNDTRIFIKQCCSLAAHGYDVTLVVADGQGDESKGKVEIVDVGCMSGRLNRIFGTTRQVLRKAIELDADFYHFHDPELIPAGLKLKRLGKKVIFDSHEDVPKQLLGKPYLTPVLLRILSVAFSFFERRACSHFDGIIAATPFIRDKFLSINSISVDINNFPMIGELDADVSWTNKRDEICYAGGIGSMRGIREVIRACEFLQTSARLNLAGRFSEPDVEAAVKAYPGWNRVNVMGFVDRAGVRDVLGRSIAGLVTFHPLPNHLDSQPNKMFEYMSAGISVIASNFPLWREIIEGNDCGLCVDPLDPKAIAGAIDFMINNPERARQMGENGQRAVQERYNWSVEEAKLLELYNKLAE
jgi:glycosyltransferase involved in cell wall biosynthesis